MRTVPDAEMACLGSAIISPDCARDLSGSMPKDAFYSDQNRALFESVKALADNGLPVDSVSVIEKLREMGLYDKSGGFEHVKKCTGAVSSWHHYGHYASLVRQAYYWRKIEECAIRIKDNPEDESNMAKLQEYATMRASDTSAKYFEIKRDIHSVLDELEKPLPKNEIVDTGFKDLDRILYGIKAGSLLTIGARPGVGKTAFCSKLAINVARAGLKTFIFSTEMSELEMMERILPMESGVLARKVRYRQLSPSDFATIANTCDDLRESCDLVIYSNPRPSIRDIRGAISRTKPDFVVVDYLQRCSIPEGNSMAYAVEAFVKSLKDIALETRCRVVLAAQVNRQKDHTQGVKPRLADLRDSGGIEHQSDQVILLHEPNPDESQDTRTIEAVVAKNRGGLLGSVNLNFEKSVVRFCNEIRREVPDDYIE